MNWLKDTLFNSSPELQIYGEINETRLNFFALATLLDVIRVGFAT